MNKLLPLLVCLLLVILAAGCVSSGLEDNPDGAASGKDESAKIKAASKDAVTSGKTKNNPPKIPAPKVAKFNVKKPKVAAGEKSYRVSIVEKELPPAEVMGHMKNAPVESLEQLEREQQIARVSGQLQTLDSTLQGLKLAATSNDPRYEQFLKQLAVDKFHPLSPSAVYWLRRFPGRDTEKFLNDLAKSGRSDIRRQVVLTMAALDEGRAVELARNLLEDEDEAVRIAAAMVLGYLPRKSSSSDLWRMVKSSPPAAAIYGAWAVSRCEGGGRGLHFLQNVARSDDAQLSLAALRLLANNREESTVRTLFDCLGSSWESKSMASASILAVIEPALRKRVLAMYQPEQAMLLGGRLDMMLYLGGNGVYPTDCVRIAQMSVAPAFLRRLALSCMVKEGSVKHLGVMILVMANSVGEMKQSAALAAKALAVKLQRPVVPNDLLSVEAWAKWWLRQYHVMAAAEQKAMLLAPWNKAIEIRTGDALDIGVRVQRITPGRDSQRREGAIVEVNLMGAPLLILPM